MAKKKEQEVIIDYAIEVEKLVTQLTKRNEQYMHDLKKALLLANLTGETVDRIQYDMMTRLIEEQKTGKTARSIYGTVSEQVRVILEGPKEDLSKPSPDWHLWLDGGLFMGSMFMIISGLANQGTTMGIVTLLMNYIAAGFALLMITKASPKYDPETFQGGKRVKALLRYVVIALFGMIAWAGAIVLLTLIPPALNPVLPKNYYIFIGAATMLAKFYLKKRLNIRGGIF